MFPPTTIPQRAGFTIQAEIKPDTLKDQAIFAQCGPKYLTGIQLRLQEGKFVIDYKNRRPHENSGPAVLTDTHKTGLAPIPGEWNKIQLSYNGRQLRLSVNGKREVFEQTGHAQWLSGFSFGGTVPGKSPKLQCFSGLLKSLEIFHYPQN